MDSRGPVRSLATYIYTAGVNMDWDLNISISLFLGYSKFITYLLWSSIRLWNWHDFQWHKITAVQTTNFYMFNITSLSSATYSSNLITCLSSATYSSNRSRNWKFPSSCSHQFYGVEPETYLNYLPRMIYISYFKCKEERHVTKYNSADMQLVNWWNI